MTDDSLIVEIHIRRANSSVVIMHMTGRATAPITWNAPADTPIVSLNGDRLEYFRYTPFREDEQVNRT